MVERVFEVEARPDVAWDELSRPEQWPEWAQFMRSVDLAPSGQVTSETRATINLRNGTRAKVAVTELVEGRSFRWDGSFLWLTLSYDHIAEPIGQDRCQVHLIVDGSGVGVGSVGRLFAWVYARNLDRSIPRLRHLLEARSRAEVPQEVVE